jgi:hypothetical protein
VGLPHLADSVAYQGADEVESEPSPPGEDAFAHGADQGTQSEHLEDQRGRGIALYQDRGDQAPQLSRRQGGRIAPKGVHHASADEAGRGDGGGEADGDRGEHGKTSLHIY